MCVLDKLFILVLCAVWTPISDAIEHSPQLINCSLSATPTTCPANSQCTQVEAESKCLCVQNYELNPAWEHFAQLTPNTFFPYCRSVNGSDVVGEEKKSGKSKLLVYIRSPARADHLVFSILLVLLAAVLAVAVIYIIKILHPLKRTKIAYVQLKRRNRKHQRLEEEFDGIAMERCDNKSAQYY